QARAKGPLSASDPAVVAAKKEAEAAAAEGLAEGHYALGRIAEELGQYNAAVTSYRNAVKAAGTDASRYSIALARALLKEGARREAGRAEAVKKPVAKGKAPAKPGALDVVALLVTLGVQAPLGKEVTPAMREAERLADEVLAKGDKVPFDVRAQALAIKGLHTRALETYARGLRAQGGRHAGRGEARAGGGGGRGRGARPHPTAVGALRAGRGGVRRPAPRGGAAGGGAGRLWGAGLTFSSARRYADAEKELLSAVE